MSDKPHQPTAHKLEKARKRGEVVKSREVISLATFAATTLFLWLGTDFVVRRIVEVVERAIHAPRSTSIASAVPWLFEAQAVMVAAGVVVVPLLAITLVAALLAGGLQARGVFSFTPIAPSFHRINPGEGLKNLFASRQLFEVAKFSVKSVLLVVILTGCVFASFGDVMRMMYADAHAVLSIVGRIVLGLFGWAMVVYAVGAALDYLHQRHEFMKKQRMTTDELRRETREDEGDPFVKAYRRATGREFAMSDMVSRAAEASVVLVNPTHVSVALSFVPGKTDLPRVVAKGVDVTALRIRTLAERKGIPIFEDVQLTRRVFREVALDDYINDGLIDAIAAVFRWARVHDQRPKSRIRS